VTSAPADTAQGTGADADHSGQSGAGDGHAAATRSSAAPASPAPFTVIGPQAPPAAARPAEVAPAAAPTPPPASTAVNDQLVAVLRPLRHKINGHYDLSVELHPAELGQVRLDVSYDGSAVHVTMHAENAATSQLLQEHLAELRSSLEQAGVNAGSLSMADGRGARPDQQAHASRSAGQRPSISSLAPAPDAAAEPVHPRSTGLSGLDLRL
jgi:flagellar hook-length control protein FliK